MHFAAPLALLASAVTAVMAADCGNRGLPNGFNIEDAWRVREIMCRDRRQHTSAWSGYTCKAYMSAGFRETLDMNVVNDKCWDGTENIINQCFIGEKKSSGSWNWGGQHYSLYTDGGAPNWTHC